MDLAHRQFLKLASAPASVSDCPRFAAALDYPTRPVRIIVAFPALAGQGLSERLRFLSSRTGGVQVGVQVGISGPKPWCARDPGCSL
jgi:hypothetical protein